MKKFVIGLTLATASAAFAQTLYVDTNATSSGFGTELTANWDDAIWKLDTNGGTPTSAWTSGAVASFGTGFSSRNLTVSLGASDTLVSGLIFNHAVTLNSSGGALVTATNVSISGSANATITANISIGTNQLNNSASGTLTLSGNNTIGTLTTSSGTLMAGSIGAFGSGTVNVQGGNLNLNGHNVSAQVITGNLTNTTVTNAQSYTGTVRFTDSSGPLDGYAGPNPTANGVFSSANIVLSGGQYLKYETSGFVRLESQFAELDLSSFDGSANQIGALTVNDGKVRTYGMNRDTLQINGDMVLNSGEYEAFDGSTQTGTSTLYLNLGNMDSSKIEVLGTAFLDGNIIVEGSYYQTESSFTYNLITAESFSGSFDNITLVELAEGFAWDTSRLNSHGELTITAVPEPATFAALAGLLALSLAFTRRCKRSMS